MTTQTIETITTALETNDSKLAVVAGADRTVMSAQEKAANTRARKALEAEAARLEQELRELEASADTGTEVAEEVAEEAIAVLDCARAAADATENFSDKFIGYGIHCSELCLDSVSGLPIADNAVELFEAGIEVAYERYREWNLTVPGSVRNAKSIVKWGIANFELTDEEGEPRNMSALKKIKAAAKNAPAKSEEASESSEEGGEAPEVANADLAIALQSIAGLNTIAGQLKKEAEQTGLTDIYTQKCIQLRQVTRRALEDYRELIDSLANPASDMADAMEEAA